MTSGGTDPMLAKPEDLIEAIARKAKRPMHTVVGRNGKEVLSLDERSVRVGRMVRDAMTAVSEVCAEGRQPADVRTAQKIRNARTTLVRQLQTYPHAREAIEEGRNPADADPYVDWTEGLIEALERLEKDPEDVSLAFPLRMSYLRFERAAVTKLARAEGVGSQVDQAMREILGADVIAAIVRTRPSDGIDIRNDAADVLAFLTEAAINQHRNLRDALDSVAPARQSDLDALAAQVEEALGGLTD
jgi:hypothetical protein